MLCFAPAPPLPSYGKFTCHLMHGGNADDCSAFCSSIIHPGGFNSAEPDHVTARFYNQNSEIIMAQYEAPDGSIDESPTWHAYL